MEEQKQTQEPREYQEERFEYAVYVNDFIICKRNFKIYNFIEGSMQTLEFKHRVDDIVKLIDDDLKSKSRVYLWRYFNPEFPDQEEELVSPLIDPWVCTFKFVVYDNKKEVISKIWDGRFYPRFVRDRVDLSNKWVRVNNDGIISTYEKEAFFKANADRLTFDQELLKAMIMDKKDVLQQITKKICEICSHTKEELNGKKYFTQSESSRLIKNFTISEKYGNGKGKPGATEYNYLMSREYAKLVDSWGRAVSDKTKEYQKTLYV